MNVNVIAINQDWQVKYIRVIDFDAMPGMLKNSCAVPGSGHRVHYGQTKAIELRHSLTSTRKVKYHLLAIYVNSWERQSTR